MGDLNSNIETKINQIENDNRTNKLNADAKKRLEDEIKKKGLNLEQIVRDNKKIVEENNTFIEKIKQLEEQFKKLYEQKNNLEKEFNQRESENKLLCEKINSDFNKRAFFEEEKKKKTEKIRRKKRRIKKTTNTLESKRKK